MSAKYRQEGKDQQPFKGARATVTGGTSEGGQETAAPWFFWKREERKKLGLLNRKVEEDGEGREIGT